MTGLPSGIMPALGAQPMTAMPGMTMRPTGGALGTPAGAPISWRWNPADKTANITLSNSDRTAQVTNSSGNGVRALAGKSAGKWYYEIHIDTNVTSSANEWSLGLGTAATSLVNFTGGQGCSILQRSAGVNSNTAAYLGGALNTGISANGAVMDIGSAGIIKWAIDIDKGLAWLSANIGWCGDPVTGTGANASGLPAATYVPLFSSYSTTVIVSIPVATAYAAPAGFLVA